MKSSASPAAIVAAVLVSIVLVAGMAWFFLFRTESLHVEQPRNTMGNTADPNGAPVRGMNNFGGRRF